MLPAPPPAPEEVGRQAKSTVQGDEGKTEKEMIRVRRNRQSALDSQYRTRAEQGRMRRVEDLLVDDGVVVLTRDPDQPTDSANLFDAWSIAPETLQSLFENGLLTREWHSVHDAASTTKNVTETQTTGSDPVVEMTSIPEEEHDVSMGSREKDMSRLQCALSGRIGCESLNIPPTIDNTARFSDCKTEQPSPELYNHDCAAYDTSHTAPTIDGMYSQDPTWFQNLPVPEEILPVCGGTEAAQQSYASNCGYTSASINFAAPDFSHPTNIVFA